MQKNKKNQQGQSLVEFVLLFLVTVSVSFAFLAIVNGNVADIWKNIITKVVTPSPDSIEFR